LGGVYTCCYSSIQPIQSIYIHSISSLSIISTPTMFLAQRTARASSSSLRLLSAAASSSTRRNASSLVYIEHKDGKLNDSVLHAVTAARQIKGDMNAVIIGTEEEVGKVTEEVKKWVVIRFGHGRGGRSSG